MDRHSITHVFNKMGPKSNTAKKPSGLSGAPNFERANNRREIAAAKKAEEEREQTALEEQITMHATMA